MTNPRDALASEGNRQPPERDFCATDTEAKLVSWLDVLDLQVDMFFERELQTLNSLPSWVQARRVLDVGCGNGRFLCRLSASCPLKRFHGLDRSPEFIHEARSRVGDVRFEIGDFGSSLLDQRFDMILMRFVVQHMQSWDEVLDAARQVLEPQGSLVVIEPDLARFRIEPPLPIFQAMLDDYGRAAASRNCLRQGLHDLAGRSIDAGWEARSRAIDVEAGTRSELRATLALYRAWVALCQASGYVEADFHAIQSELDDWDRREGTASFIGLTLLELKPGRVS